MGKRQTRLFSHQLLEKSVALAGQEANITLHNQATFHGVVLEVTKEQIKLRDMRLKKHIFKIEEIAEIVLDQATDW